jgi:glycine betaine/choline ABC-type transport system substrate-binding protein
MSAGLPDYPRSRAILIGTSVYHDKRFRQLPAARNSLHGVREVLVDERLCGWPEERVEVLPDQQHRPRLITDLRRWARETTDVLIVYFVGHGIITPHGELCLALTDTALDDPDVTGLEYRFVRAALIDSPARVKVVILDCCYSGRAIQALSSPEDFGDIRGAYVIAASDHAAHVPPPAQQPLACTSFTGELLELIRTGIPGAPDTLTLHLIYTHLRARLHSARLPEPNHWGTDTAEDFALTRNAAYLPEPIERFPRPAPGAALARWSWRARILAATAAVMLVGATYIIARASAFGRPPDTPLCGAVSTAPAAAGDGVVIGSGDFPENELVAQIYADALMDRHVSVAPIESGLSSREIYYPEVRSGQITIIPEYNGALLTTCVNPASTAVTTSQVDAALRAGLPPTMTILNPSPAQDRDSVTVTQATAARYHLVSIADLRRVARDLTIGGPSEFQQREQGLLGLQSVYGLTFGHFRVLDDSGPESLTALLTGQVQVADIFTTDPAIKRDHLVQLTDPRHLFTTGNIVPLVYRPGVNPTIIDTLNEVSAKLTMASLQSMDDQVFAGRDIQTVASQWLAQADVAGPAGQDWLGFGAGEAALRSGFCRQPHVRPGSEGIQRIRQELPATRNPITYYKRVIEAHAKPLPNELPAMRIMPRYPAGLSGKHFYLFRVSVTIVTLTRNKS